MTYKCKLAAVSIMLLSVMLASCKIKSADAGGSTAQDLTGKDTVTISIQCKTILDNKEKLKPEIAKIIPEDGIILEETEALVLEGESALDILLKISKEKKIAINKKGSDESVYIAGINGIGEFDCGGGSGWIYKINDEKMSTSCGAAKVKKSDSIEFIYTCDMGSDIS